MRYALIRDKRVFEIFDDIEATQVPHPEPLGDDPSDSEKAFYEATKAAHDNFTPGPIPIEQRFHSDMLKKMVPIPDGADVQVGDSFNGQAFIPQVEPSTEMSRADHVHHFRQMIRIHLDQCCKRWDYDSMLDAASYAMSFVDISKREALALIGWRDQVYIWATPFLNEVLNEVSVVPTEHQFIAQIPPMPSRPS